MATVITVGKQLATVITVGKQFATVITVGKQFATVFVQEKHFIKNKWEAVLRCHLWATVDISPKSFMSSSIKYKK